MLHKKQQSAKPFLGGLTYPLLETPDEWILHSFSYGNYLRELGRYAPSEIYKKSSVDLAQRNTFRATRKFLMEHYRLGEDEAVALISLGVDFGITQVADGNWGVHAIVRKKMFGERAVSIKNELMHRGKLFGHLVGMTAHSDIPTLRAQNVRKKRMARGIASLVAAAFAGTSLRPLPGSWVAPECRTSVHSMHGKPQQLRVNGSAQLHRDDALLC